MNSNATFLWSIGVIGLLLLIVGLREFPYQRRLRRSGVRVAGTVVRGRGHHHYAVVGFTGTDGSRGEVKAKSPGAQRWPLGHEVPIVYPQGAPSQARIDLPSERAVRKGVILVVGATFTALPFLYTFL